MTTMAPFLRCWAASTRCEHGSCLATIADASLSAYGTNAVRAWPLPQLFLISVIMAIWQRWMPCFLLWKVSCLYLTRCERSSCMATFAAYLFLWRYTTTIAAFLLVWRFGNGDFIAFFCGNDSQYVPFLAAYLFCRCLRWLCCQGVAQPSSENEALLLCAAKELNSLGPYVTVVKVLRAHCE